MKTARIGKRRSAQIFGEINITPLTDIFLVLLIIMMVVAPMLNTTGLKLAVPTAAPSEEQKEDPKVTRVRINQQGQYTIADQAIGAEQLASQIRQRKTESPDGVIIEVNPDASHEALTVAMDAVQAAGVDKLAVTANEGTDQ